LLFLPYGCFFSDTKGKKADTSGTGGTTSQPTTHTPSGGVGGVNTENAGGDSGNGGAKPTTTIPDIACESDVICKPEGLLCNTDIGKCVQCKADNDCTDGASCVAGVCGGQAGCTTNDDCADSSSGKACDEQRGRCVACVTADDCADPETSECVNNACAKISPCTNSLSCTEATLPVCNTSASPARCVQCVTNADCTALGVGDTCANNKCSKACETNDNCTDGLKCNTSGSSKFCAQCAQHADCAENQYCDKGSCVADVCVAGVDQACIDGGVATCNDDGDGFGSSEACPADKSCTANNSRATCGGGGVTPSCSNNPGTVDPCDGIPAFTGTQTVDGKADDFCSIPSFELSFANAAGVNNNKVTSGSTSDFKQRAVAKVAWSADALHAFIQVFTKPVRSNSSVDKIWDGDSVEMMITTNGSASGTTSTDDKALHVIANNSIAVTVKSTGESGTHTQISDSNQVWVGYMGNDEGYAVELKLPWPGGATPSSGASVRFDLALNVDTESVDPTVWGRDAQAVLNMETVSGTSTCSATPATPFCDERLWCSTKLK
jgi:hypothetical protein